MKHRTEIIRLLAGNNRPQSAELAEIALTKLIQAGDDEHHLSNAINQTVFDIHERATNGTDAAAVFHSLILADPVNHQLAAKAAIHIIGDRTLGNNTDAIKRAAFVGGFILGHLEAVIKLDALDAMEGRGCCTITDDDLPKNLALFVATSLNVRNQGIPQFPQDMLGRIQNACLGFSGRVRSTRFFREIRKYDNGSFVGRMGASPMNQSGEMQFVRILMQTAFKARNFSEQVEMLIGQDRPNTP